LASSSLLISSENAAALALSTALDGAPLFPGLTVSGGVVAGVPTLASDAIGTRLILVDTSRVFVADDGEADVVMASHATIELSDVPDGAVTAGSPLAPVATDVVSL